MTWSASLVVRTSSGTSLPRASAGGFPVLFVVQGAGDSTRCVAPVIDLKFFFDFTAGWVL